MLASLKKTALLLGGVALMASAASVQAQFQTRTLRASTGTTSDHPIKDGFDAMNTCTQAASGGKMRIRVFWDSVLGSDAPATQSARTGSIDLVLTATSPLTTVVPAFGVFDLPFLFNSSEEADALLDGAVGDWFLAKLPAVGLIGLGWWENGFRHATNSHRAITRLEDFNGLKMRVMQSPIQLDTFTTLGTNAVPMAFSEVYSALETRTVDGQENPLGLIKSMKFYEVQKHLTLSRHTYSPLALLFSKKIWDGLSDDERRVLQQCAVVGRDAERRVLRAKEAQLLDYLRDEGGLAVNEIAADEMQRIRAHTASVHTRNASVIGQEAIEKVNAELQKIRQ